MWIVDPTAWCKPPSEEGGRSEEPTAGTSLIFICGPQLWGDVTAYWGSGDVTEVTEVLSEEKLLYGGEIAQRNCCMVAR